MYIVRFPSLFSKQDTFTKLDEDGEHRFIAGSGDYICFLNGCFHFEDRACQNSIDMARTWLLSDNFL